MLLAYLCQFYGNNWTVPRFGCAARDHFVPQSPTEARVWDACKNWLVTHVCLKVRGAGTGRPGAVDRGGEPAVNAPLPLPERVVGSVLPAAQRVPGGTRSHGHSSDQLNHPPLFQRPPLAGFSPVHSPFLFPDCRPPCLRLCFPGTQVTRPPERLCWKRSVACGIPL